MTRKLEETVRTTCSRYGDERNSLIDILRDVQAEHRCVPKPAQKIVAEALQIPQVEVESVVSFYSFLTEEPIGRFAIRMCHNIIDRMGGFAQVAEAACDELGITFGETTSDGLFSLEHTSCIGMCDQGPAALVNDTVVTGLTPSSMREVITELRDHGDPARLVKTYGDGQNTHPLVRAMVSNNIRQAGPVIFSPINRAEAISKALGMSPAEVIRAIKTSHLRGRGGAGFPTGIKWEFAARAVGDRKFVLCNADEGEPGTFKDRVLLTELPDRVFAGMTVAGYAIGSREGIVYLRSEYVYLLPYLNEVLEARRRDGLLGATILGHADFSFDIRIQMGAGAYICGEETALISSLEGWRGDPKTRPPYPAQSGFLGLPSVVNNVETLCCVTKILEEGPATFSEYGSEHSSGTKVLSISGDCRKPGVYEVSFGMTLHEVLELCGAEDAAAVQVGGASGWMIPPSEYDRRICFDDLATGGSIEVFGPQRNLLEVVHDYLAFFSHESCGYCTPCRAGTVTLQQTIERFLKGRGDPEDLEQMTALARTMKAASRCGLGQTASNPVKGTMEKFPGIYEAAMARAEEGMRPRFDWAAAVADAEHITGRNSRHVETH